MKFSDVKVRHIYSVNFDPVRMCEFNSHHYALVLKKNVDKKTVIVMPLTTSSNGDGVNKINLGILKTMPLALQSNPTYAVFNQIRTLNTNRFNPMLDGSNNIIECPLDTTTFDKLINLGVSDMMYEMDIDNKINLLKTLYDTQCTNKAVNLAYNILILQKQSGCINQEISHIKKEIKDTLFNVPYNLEQKDIDNGIKTLLDGIINISQ